MKTSRSVSKKKLSFTILLVCLVLGGFATGCSRERALNGQVFIVTKGAQNIKLGLVDIFLLDESSATNLARQIQKRAETQIPVLQSEIKLAQEALAAANTRLFEFSKTNYAVSPTYQQDIEDLKRCQTNAAIYERNVEIFTRRESYKMRDLSQKELDQEMASLKSASERIERRLKNASNETARLENEVQLAQGLIFERQNDLTNFSPVAFYLGSPLLPLKAQCTTDADGKFSIRIPAEKHLAVLARATRQVGEQKEKYAWFCWIPTDAKTDQFFLSNNNLCTVKGAHNVATE